MYLQIDPRNGNPIYMQIIEQIKHAIQIGIFEVGKPIPTIRDMAIELCVNPNTVAKAVRELEREGVIKTFVGKGAFVTDKAKNVMEQDNTEKAVKVTESYIKDVKWLGYKKEQTIELVKKNWNKLEKENNHE
ncbi:MAG: GntR family transcriptional regulator [Candidatus Sericytochromatia bacterium]|nr:GntR family transcriptional regulator [Candidatus Sericytochromatia bacterium]